MALEIDPRQVEHFALMPIRRPPDYAHGGRTREFAGLIVLLSWITSRLGLEAVNPKDGMVVEPVNLLSVHGLHWILDNTVENFT